MRRGLWSRRLRPTGRRVSGTYAQSYWAYSREQPITHTGVKSLSSKIITLLAENRLLISENAFSFWKKDRSRLTRTAKLFNLLSSVEAGSSLRPRLFRFPQLNISCQRSSLLLVAGSQRALRLQSRRASLFQVAMITPANAHLDTGAPEHRRDNR
jgi:hypothetical protein